MRRHEPCTSLSTPRESGVKAAATLATTADAEGRIVYANAASVDASGFCRAELQGQPQDMLLHPDMPQQAIVDRWATLQAGDPWSGLLKNRRADGEAVWTQAHTAPVMRDGQPVGFVSVQCQASDDDIAAAERMYQRFREGTAGTRRFHKGLIVRGGVAACSAWLQTAPMRWRIRAALMGLVPLLLLGAMLSGLTGAALAGYAGMAMLAGAAASWLLELQVSQPLEQLANHARGLAAGGERQPLRMKRIDEIGMTGRSLDQLGLMFRWLVDDISEMPQPAATRPMQTPTDMQTATEAPARMPAETPPARNAAVEPLAPFPQWREARLARRRVEQFDDWPSYRRARPAPSRAESAGAMR